MKVKIQLKDIASYSKGQQINNADLLEDGEYDYLNGGIMPSGKWSKYNTPGETVTISEGGNSCGYVNYMRKPFWCGAHCYFLFNTIENTEYLYYALKSQQDRLMNIRTGACMPNIKKNDLGGFELTYEDDKAQQEVIVTVLKKIETIIAYRKQQLQTLDNLVKARFVEMFGDPEQNPKSWPVVKITEIIGGKVSNGFFAKREAYLDDGNVQVLGVANVVNRMYSNIENLPKTNATQAEKEKYGIRYGDMLFCRSSLVAEGIGKASIVPKGTPGNVLFECHVIRLPLNLQRCIPEFVQTLSTTEFFRRQIIAQSKTATMTTIGQDGILKSVIILPPIEYQQEFLRFVTQVDKSKYV